jgi:PAS domain S-box-containing protein
LRQPVYLIFGRNPQELGATFDEFLSSVHPDDRDRVYNAVKKALHGEPVAGNYSIILANGEERIVHTYIEVIFDNKNVPVRIKGIVQDITENKKFEEKIRESEEKYRNIVETANEGIYLMNGEAIITYANKQIVEMSGYSLEEIVGRPIWDFMSEESKPIAEINLEKRLQGINESYELKLKRKNGSSMWAFLSAKPFFNKDGELTGYLGMFTDITKRKEAEQALVDIEIARKKEIHHRIKNNLQVISSLLDLQAEKFKDREYIKYSEVLEAFRESQDRVISMALIHEELYKGGGLEKLDFSPYIEELAENLFHTYCLGNTDINLKLNLENNVFFDMDVAVPLGMIINELVSNSFKLCFQRNALFAWILF